MSKKFITFFIILILFHLSFAQSGIGHIKNEIIKILSRLIRFLFASFMLIGGGLLIILGIKYVTGGGKVEELHRALLFLIIGIVLLILSFFIPKIIESFINSAIGS